MTPSRARQMRAVLGARRCVTRSRSRRLRDSSWRWRQQLVQTCLERDLPSLGLRVGADTPHRFWAMLAHYHAQIWNASELTAPSAWLTRRCRQHEVASLSSRSELSFEGALENRREQRRDPGGSVGLQSAQTVRLRLQMAQF